MKKFTLSVSEPCHEDWNKMTPDEKGRFCGSCQKTVVDFTNMSDRQLAQFFKKSASSVCGRFHNDQLGRSIEVPKKRVPWVKYFFQFTWPAFVLFLKSCNAKDEQLNVMGVPLAIEQGTSPSDSLPKKGKPLLQITPEDTTKTQELLSCFSTPTVEFVSVIDSDKVASTDTVTIPVFHDENNSNEIDTAMNVVDTSSQVASDTLDGKCFITTGLVAAVIFRKEEKPQPVKASEVSVAKTNKINTLLYPDPITQGQLLKVKVSGKLDGYYEVLNLSGQMLRTKKINFTEKQLLSIDIPSWPAGAYFLRLVDESNGNNTTQKFIVQ